MDHLFLVSNEVTATTFSGVKFVKMCGHARFAIVYQPSWKTVRGINLNPFVNANGATVSEEWMTDIVQIERNFVMKNAFIFLTGDGKIRRYSNFELGYQGYPNQSVMCSFIGLLTIIHEYLCIRKSDNKLYKINADTGGF